MLRLHLRKVPAEHEIGFLKKKLGSTQEEREFLLNRHRAMYSFCPNP
jgi:hypothetical protein